MNPDEATDILSRVLKRLDSVEARLTSLEAARQVPLIDRHPFQTVENEERIENVAAPPVERRPTLLPAEPPPEPPATPAFSEEAVVDSAAEPQAQFETQVGLTWLNRIGVLTVVLGVAFLFKYAVDNRLIGEVGRVILGVLISFAAMGLAEVMQRRDHRIYAQGITGAGVAILYLSLYASFGFYHLIPQFAAFVLMFLATALTIALSLRYKSLAISFLGLIGGYLTPLVLGANQSHPWGLFGYLLILQAGGIALSLRYKSVAIALFGLVAGFLTPLLLFDNHSHPWVLLGYLLILQAGGVLLSVRYSSRAIAFLAFIGGYLAPLALGASEGHAWALFAYLLILQAGGIAVSRRANWQYIEALLLIGTSFVYLVSQLGTHNLVGTLAVLVFYAIFWTYSSVSILIPAHLLAVLAVVFIWPAPQAQSLGINLLLAGAGVYAVKRRTLPLLALLAFFPFWIAAAFWASYSSSNLLPGIAALTAGFLLFLAYVLREAPSTGVDEDIDPRLVILAMDGLAYFGICYWKLHADYHDFLGLFAASLAAVHLFLAWQMWQQFEPDSEARTDLSSDRFRPILLAIGVSITFLTLAIPIQFAGFRITMFWAIEGAAFTWIAARTGNKRFGSAALAIFVLAFVRLLGSDGSMYNSVSHQMNNPDHAHPLLINARFLTFITVSVCCWMSARWMEKPLPAVSQYVAGHFIFLVALMQETLEWAAQRTSMGDPSSIGTVSASILLALYGIGLVILGVSTRSLINRILGLGLMALVVLKLYLNDVWQLQETFRIVAFVVLGVLLLVASFLYSRFRRVVERLWDSDAAAP